MPKKYTLEMLDLIYKAGKAVYEHNAVPEDYKEKCEEFGINWRSFKGWFIPAFRYFRTGTTLKGSMPQLVYKYMLERIHAEYGNAGLYLALKSYMGTIEYYESKGIGKPGDKIIIQHFQSILDKY